LEDKISQTSVVVAAKNHVSCELVDEVVILHFKSGVYYGLNSIAKHVWSLIQEPRTVSSLLKLLTERYEVTHERCEGDLIALLQDLGRRELIEVRTELDPVGK
jgi:Coenzyme PQQ synthesis protein D (PqqD)